MACAAFVGCARPTPPVAPRPVVLPATAPPTPTVSPEVAAPPPTPTLSPAAAAAAEEVPSIPEAPVVRRGSCFVRVTQVYPCHGAPLNAPPEPMRVELCDGCRVDADCRRPRGGRCVVVPGNTCAPPLRACRYPNDACSRCEGRPTFETPGCVNDGAGHAVCARTGPPPPAAPR
jgi:hypothetical protein